MYHIKSEKSIKGVAALICNSPFEVGFVGIRRRFVFILKHRFNEKSFSSKQKRLFFNAHRRGLCYIDNPCRRMA